MLRLSRSRVGPPPAQSRLDQKLPAAIDRIEQDGRVVRNWKTFHARHGDGSWMLTLSLPAYAESKDLALLYFEAGRKDASEGWLYLMERRSGVWIVTQRELQWALERS